MYDSLAYGTLAPIAERLAREIFAQTGLDETLITHENDYSVVAGIVMREIELLMTAEFITLRSSENHRERQREGEERERVRKEEAMAAIQIGLEPREAEVRTPCGEVLPECILGCLCDVCDEALTHEVRERNALPLHEKFGQAGRKIHLALS